MGSIREFQSDPFQFFCPKTTPWPQAFFRSFTVQMRCPNSLLMVCYGGLKSGKEVEGNRKKTRLFMTTMKYFVPSSFTRHPQLYHPSIRDIHRKIAFHAHFTAFLNHFAQFGCAKRNVPEKVFANPFIPSGK
jgi:hypothetical protein